MISYSIGRQYSSKNYTFSSIKNVFAGLESLGKNTVDIVETLFLALLCHLITRYNSISKDFVTL